jgi:apolipoprotein N-acyltransferase
LLGLVLEDRDEIYNSAVLIHDPGIVLGRYDKEALVPIGESGHLVPGLPDLSPIVPVATRFASGTNSAPMVVDGHRIGVSICYEDILSQFVRRRVLADEPELLVNLTSDAWFRGTDAIDFHLALAKLRSVEHRKYLIRSTRDGASAVVDSGGRVRRRVDSAATEAFVATIHWLPGLTVYARYGTMWLFGIVALPVAIALARLRGGAGMRKTRGISRLKRVG